MTTLCANRSILLVQEGKLEDRSSKSWSRSIKAAFEENAAEAVHRVRLDACQYKSIIIGMANTSIYTFRNVPPSPHHLTQTRYLTALLPSAAPLLPLDDQPAHIAHATIPDRLALTALLVPYKLGLYRY